MRTILTTVGISLISPNKHGGKTPNDQDLANYLSRANPAEASAETNSLSRIPDFNSNDSIVFLCSDTEQGKLCAEVLEKHYNKKYMASVKVIPGLTYKESKFKVQGLRSFVSTLINLVREHKKSGEVLINATGGFKAEMAYANLIGLLFNVPVFYIHELFKDIIEMPAPPIGWDYSLIADYEDFFEWINEDFQKTAQVDNRLQKLPQEIHQEIRFLLEDEEGFTLLSPTGEVLFEAFREQQASYASVPVWLSREAQSTYNSAVQSKKVLFDRTLRKLRSRPLRNSGSHQVDNCDCRVYPSGHRNERLFWFEGVDGNPHVCELAFHNDESYERLINQGVNKSEYQNFEEWNDPT